MCGLVGVVGRGADDDDALRNAAAALAHRGPDGIHILDLGPVAFAHTRLAVIDPTNASDQPMTDEKTGCTLVFNGEIYNYRELRSELERLGHLFRSTGDTEVLLRSYLEWGDTCVAHLNGMFAFAIWDPRSRSTFLARDRLGEKPLHWCEHDGAIWFASELKALLAAGVAGANADATYLLLFLAHGDLGHPDRTPVAGVRQLPAAHAARIGDDRLLRTWRYWDVPDEEFGTQTAAEVDAQFESLFDDSVLLRLRSDVPLGTSLSGGLDSSLVLATVRRHRPDGELHAFTASFPGTDADELERAEAVAKRCGATVHAVPLGAQDLLVDLDAMIRANESPVESPSTLAQYRVMQEASNAGIVVLLDGQGADETWGGYDKYAGAALVDEVVTGHVGTARRLARDWHAIRGSALRPPAARYLAMTAPSAVRDRAARVATRREGWLSPEWASAYAVDPLSPATVRPRAGRVADANARLDLTRVTLPRLLRYADRNSMAWSREVRLPFLDHRLVELAARTPFRLKVRGGWSKEPIRHALEHLDLDWVARRRDKKAYMPPTGAWLAEGRVAERVRAAWRDLHAAGLLASPTPVDATLPRWRVLATHAWASAYGVKLG